MAARDKVLCRTPTHGKKPTKIDAQKFEIIRNAIRRTLPRRGNGMLFSELTDAVESELTPGEIKQFGSLMWYVTTVKLELEVRGEIERVAGSKPQRLILG